MTQLQLQMQEVPRPKLSSTHKRIVDALHASGWQTLHELRTLMVLRWARAPAETSLSARIRELRHLGYQVETRCGRTTSGGLRYEYRIAGGAP